MLERFFNYLASNFWEISFTRNPEKFGTGALGLYSEVSRKFRLHEISREIWKRSSGAVFRNFSKKFGSKIYWKFWGGFEYFLFQNSPGILVGTRNASSQDYTKR